MVKATAEPSFVPEQRARKAEHVANRVLLDGIDPRAVARMSDAEWVALAKAAGLDRPCSPTTRFVVMEYLAGSARDRSVCPFCKIGDPAGPLGPPRPFGHDGDCTHR